MLAIAMLLFVTGVSQSFGQDGSQAGPQSGMSPSPAIIYDCAANSLFVICRKAEINLSYKEAIHLLPVGPQGNSMLQVKHALETCGFQFEGVKLKLDELLRIQVPTIVFADKSASEDGSSGIGHYFVSWPINEDLVQLLDYPRKQVTLDKYIWVRHLKTIGIEEVYVLLCGKKGQKLDEMLLLKSRLKRHFSSTEEGGILYKDHQEIVLSDLMTRYPVTWDLGNVAEGTLLTRKVQILNKTGRLVHIEKTISSCEGCMKLVVDKETLHPEEICGVTVSIDLAGKKEPNLSIGANVIFSSEAILPPVNIRAFGRLHPRVETKPKSVDFGICRPEAGPVIRTIVVSRTSYGKGSHISSVTCSVPYIKALIVESPLNSDKECDIRLVLEPDKVVGRFETQAAIFAEGEKTACASFGIFGEVQSWFSIQPQRLFVLNRNPSEETYGRITIRHIEGRGLSLMDVRIEKCQWADMVKVVSKPLSRDEIEVELHCGGQRPPVIRGEVVARLRIEAEEEVNQVNVPFVLVSGTGTDNGLTGNHLSSDDVNLTEQAIRHL